MLATCRTDPRRRRRLRHPTTTATTATRRRFPRRHPARCPRHHRAPCRRHRHPPDRGPARGRPSPRPAPARVGCARPASPCSGARRRRPCCSCSPCCAAATCGRDLERGELSVAGRLDDADSLVGSSFGLLFLLAVATLIVLSIWSLRVGRRARLAGATDVSPGVAVRELVHPLRRRHRAVRPAPSHRPPRRPPDRVDEPLAGVPHRQLDRRDGRARPGADGGRPVRGHRRQAAARRSSPRSCCSSRRS